MSQPSVQLRRQILRVCRTLGPTWKPKPPANAQLWGRGYWGKVEAPHPRLINLVPPALQECLSSNSNVAVTTWLRERMRECGGNGDKGEAIGKDALDFLSNQAELLPCMSACEENGLRVDAVSGFLSQQSGKHVFTYTLRFTNTGSKPVRVLSRQYEFREGSGALASQIRSQQPEAAGVVGFTPLVQPGEFFEFGSGVPLNSKRGSANGSFLAMVEPDLTGEDLELHKKMEKAELMLRFVYYKGLGTEQFRLPLGLLRFEATVPCAWTPLEVEVGFPS